MFEDELTWASLFASAILINVASKNGLTGESATVVGLKKHQREDVVDVNEMESLIWNKIEV